MFAYEPPLDPPCDEWTEYKLPELCKDRIEEICKNILKKGEDTYYARIYDALYELVEQDIEQEYAEASYD
jgi:hypothetical protein